MPGRKRASSTKPSSIAVVDIGSNSVRLVVFDGLKRMPLVLHNEKVTCELGRGLGTTGRLEPAAIEKTVASVTRFVDQAQGWGAGRITLLATAAVRDAVNGPVLTQQLTERLRLPVAVLSGAQEAKLSAMGVVFGEPRAQGIMGDLGGGSLEFVALDNGRPGRNATLPLGPLRLMGIADVPTSATARDAIDGPLADLAWLPQSSGQTFYAVGGAWRSLARLHMDQVDHPLRIIHHYRISRAEAEDVCGLVVRLGRQSLRRIVAVSRNRLDVLPWAALTLQRILAAVAPTEVVFSANGLREGYLLSLLPPALRRLDPLIAACRDMVAGRDRMASQGDAVFRWMSPIFPEEPEAETRLRHAASILGDMAWRDHPEYRAESSFLAALRFPYNCIAHDERAFLAIALLARYGASVELDLARGARSLLDGEAVKRAVVLGLALRLARTLAEGSATWFTAWTLRLDSKRLVIEPTGSARTPELGDGEQRRFAALAAALGRDPEVAAPSKARTAAR
ncbi:MAG: Ppx/GppA family phosphatase [Alphaproteobacteria bacterium]|nr:Ppx/GppA family phosphatase [Alphaproteobacteria bacterium]